MAQETEGAGEAEKVQEAAVQNSEVAEEVDPKRTACVSYPAAICLESSATPYADYCGEYVFFLSAVAFALARPL